MPALEDDPLAGVVRSVERWTRTWTMPGAVTSGDERAVGILGAVLQRPEERLDEGVVIADTGSTE